MRKSFTLKSIILLMPLTTIDAASNELRGSHIYLSSLFNAKPQIPNKDCRATHEDGSLVYATDQYTYYSPSFFETCMESLPLDVDNAIHHIENLNGIFSQFHCFYHLAKDPTDSRPINYQQELGYTLFGEGEGQVDMAQRMTDLAADIRSNRAANISTFWTMNAVLQDLRDGHVQVPPVTGEAFVTWMLRIFPERTLKGDILAKPEFSLQGDDVLLKIHWLNEKSGKETATRVKSINGQRVSDFVKTLSSSRSVQLTWQSLGARVNMFYKAATSRGYQPSLFPLTFNTKPTDALPDKFTVVYADGTEETFRTGIFNPGMAGVMGASDEDPEVYELQNRSFVESFINRPGMAHQYYSEARGDIVEAVAETFDELTAVGRISKKVAALQAIGDDIPAKKTLAATRSFDLGVDSFEFDRVWSRDFARVGEDGEPVVVSETMMGYKIEKDYAILKVGTWMVDPILFRNEVWSNLTEAAKEQGVAKLMVDIAGNGGGIGANAAILAVSMFPEVDYQWLSDNLDQTYNDPMADYVNIVTPLLAVFENMTESWSNMDMTLLMDRLSRDQVEALSLTARSLEKFCALSNTPNLCAGPKCEPSCNLKPINDLAKEVDNFLLYPSPPTYHDVWQAMLVVARELSAWTITLGGTISQLRGEAEKTSSVVRGGVKYNVTSRGSLLWYTDYNEAARKALQAQHTFEEYVVVSDGVAASASSIFASLVDQIGKNRDRSKATSRVTTVAYGGTGTQSDLTMASIPAAVEDVRLDNSFYTTFSLLMMPMMFPYNDATEEMLESVVNTVQYLDSRTFRPSYYAQSLPRMPVQNYYDRFMDPGALPLQYVKMQPDEYIPEIFTATSFDEGHDLASLYALASQFFSVSNGGGIFGSQLTVEKTTKIAPLQDMEQKESTTSNGEDASGARSMFATSVVSMAATVLLALSP